MKVAIGGSAFQIPAVAIAKIFKLLPVFICRRSAGLQHIVHDRVGIALVAFLKPERSGIAFRIAGRAEDHLRKPFKG
jgi:hypothetical protein